MENKAIIKICAIVIGVFVMFAIIEISIKGIGKKVNEFSEKKEEEKKQEEIYNSDEAVEERMVKDFINTVCKAIRDNDYDYLWQALDNAYRKYKFNDNIEELKTYINANVNLGETHQVTYTKKVGKIYIATVGVTNGDSYFSKYFTVDTKEENAFKFMFDEYVSMEEVSEIAAYSDLKFELIYKYDDSITKNYVIKVDNIIESDVNIKFTGTSLFYSSGRKVSGSIPISLDLKSNESGEIEIYFRTDNNYPDSLELEIIKNGENKKYQINFSEYTA